MSSTFFGAAFAGVGEDWELTLQLEPQEEAVPQDDFALHVEILPQEDLVPQLE